MNRAEMLSGDALLRMISGCSFLLPNDMTVR